MKRKAPTMGSNTSRILVIMAAGIVAMNAPGLADDSRLRPIEARLDSIDVLSIVHEPSDPDRSVSTRSATSRGDCPPEILAHTDSSFGAGQYVLQAGFEEGESTGISFSLPPEAFPVRLDLAEIMFGTYNATVQTTTEWSIVVYSGTPASGSLVAQYSSDGVILPHLVMPPGTTGTIIQFSVDPGDPDQIYIPDDGSGIISIGFRIDAHHSPGNPCLSPPNENMNAFPTTDTSGLQAASGNWINMVPGSFCICGTGWRTFAQLPSLCQPSGDWVMRATVTPFDCQAASGACCIPDGSCADATSSQCDLLEGDYQGDGTSCSIEGCPELTGACCVPSTEACVDNTTESMCTSFGGSWLVGQVCSDVTCFPVGACCTVEGECIPDVEEDACEGFGGAFQGHGSSCDTVDCPAPEGWCCTDSGDCFDLPEETCDAFGGTWGGSQSSCNDADACDPGNDCPGDLDGNGVVNVDDILLVLSNYGETGSGGDADGDGDTDVDDILMVINGWGDC